MRLHNQSLLALAFQAIDAAMSASWRTLESIDQLIQSFEDEQQSSDLGLFVRSLCAIRDGEKYVSCASMLADVSLVGAIELSFASAHLGLCSQFIFIELTTKANSEAIAYGRFLIAAGRSCGLEFSCLQEKWLLSRASALPAKLKSQQLLGLARKLGRVSKKFCFILGMHRSGTSALAGLLSEMGLGAPRDLMPATQDNPKGYYESTGIMQANDQLLASLKTNWTLEVPLPQGWPDSEAASSWRDSLLLRIENSFSEADLPVIKDPRFCVLVDGLECWLKDYTVEIKFILLIRDPKEVVASLLARPNDPIKRRAAFKLWIESVLTAEYATRRLDRMILMADDLFEDPDAVEAMINRFLVRDLNSQDLGSPSSFIDASMRHQYSSQENRGKISFASMQCHHLEDLSAAIYDLFKRGGSCLCEDTLDEYRHMVAL